MEITTELHDYVNESLSHIGKGKFMVMAIDAAYKIGSEHFNCISDLSPEFEVAMLDGVISDLKCKQKEGIKLFTDNIASEVSCYDDETAFVINAIKGKFKNMSILLFIPERLEGNLRVTLMCGTLLEHGPDVVFSAIETRIRDRISNDGKLLMGVKNQTEELCLEAVKQDGKALEFVKKQTEAIQLEAIAQNGWALRYINEPTEEICLAAFQQNIAAMSFIDKKFIQG